MLFKKLDILLSIFISFLAEDMRSSFLPISRKLAFGVASKFHYLIWISSKLIFVLCLLNIGPPYHISVEGICCNLYSIQ